jgi:hypothetical protein
MSEISFIALIKFQHLTIRAIEQYGHFEIHGDLEILEPMDALLSSFVDQQRMKLPGKTYRPCYQVIK